MIIFATSDGSKMEYIPPRPRQAVPVNGVLSVESSHPVAAITLRVSRGALLRIALRCVWASVLRG